MPEYVIVSYPSPLGAGKVSEARGWGGGSLNLIFFFGGLSPTSGVETSHGGTSMLILVCDTGQHWVEFSGLIQKICPVFWPAEAYDI